MASRASSVPTRFLDGIRLLDGVAFEKRSAVLNCLDARVTTFEAGQRMTPAFVREAPYTRVIIDGTAQLERNDAMGNRSILDACSVGAVVMSEAAPRSVLAPDMAVVANSSCTTLDFRILEQRETCECCAKYIGRVKGNLIDTLLASNRQLMRKLDLLSCRSMREKVLMYLHEESRRAHASTFDIPYNRQELADLLCIERSALSRELSRMQAEGIIAFERNRFSLG